MVGMFPQYKKTLEMFVPHLSRMFNSWKNTLQSLARHSVTVRKLRCTALSSRQKANGHWKLIDHCCIYIKYFYNFCNCAMLITFILKSQWPTQHLMDVSYWTPFWCMTSVCISYLSLRSNPSHELFPYLVLPNSRSAEIYMIYGNIYHEIEIFYLYISFFLADSLSLNVHKSSSYLR